MPGTLWLVATPIGNLEDMTFRAVRVLREASVIAAEDTRRTANLLSHYDIGTPTLSLHEHNERARIPQLLARLQAGQHVAVVTDAGMPGLADPGYRIVRAALDEGIRVEVIPGASALTTALAGSGLPVDRVAFVGFAPPRDAERRRWFEQFRDWDGTLVFFETPHRLRQSLASLADVLGNRPAVVAHELTKLHESWHRGHVTEIVAMETLPTKGEFTVVIGPSDGPPQAAAEGRPTLERISAEFGQLTDSDGLSRRDAISKLAVRYGLPKRSVYGMVEDAKRSGE
jgi:16S rRNA (cytidine1402-2'-O)-methyltransferase